MAGKSLFKVGRHPSRYGIGSASITQISAAKLNDKISKILERTIGDKDFARLLDAVVLAKVSSGRRGEESGEIAHRVILPAAHASEQDIEMYVLEPMPPPVTYPMVRRKDIEAQLRAMRKICNDDALINALRACDTWTFSVINMASIDVMSDALWERGEFTDADGEVWRTPRSIYCGSIDSPPILPLGVAGLRQAIGRALSALDGHENAGSSEFRNALERMPILAKGRGPREKPFQAVLADECIALWKKYGQPSRRKPWATTDTEKRSRIVDFSRVVFEEAGMKLFDRRLVTLLCLARKAKATNLRRDRRFIASLRKRAN